MNLVSLVQSEEELADAEQTHHSAKHALEQAQAALIQAQDTLEIPTGR